MRKTGCGIILAAALAAGAAPLQALEKPQASVWDRHMKTAVWRPGQVYPVHAVNGYVCTIIFEKGEKVQAHSSGFSTAWEFAARENHFFLKPASAHGTTNLVIVTDRRTYLFDIILGNDRSRATYLLAFSYPTETAAGMRQEIERAEISKRLSRPLTEGRELPGKGTGSAGEPYAGGTNRSYTMNFGADTASRFIAPLEAFDDGRFTFLRFRRQSDWPSAYRVENEGGSETETLLNSHIEGGWLVIHGVYRGLRLRAGQAVVGIYNEAYDGGGAGSETGVPVPGLVRGTAAGAGNGGL